MLVARQCQRDDNHRRSPRWAYRRDGGRRRCARRRPRGEHGLPGRQGRAGDRQDAPAGRAGGAGGCPMRARCWPAARPSSSATSRSGCSSMRWTSTSPAWIRSSSGRCARTSGSSWRRCSRCWPITPRTAGRCSRTSATARTGRCASCSSDWRCAAPLVLDARRRALGRSRVGRPARGAAAQPARRGRPPRGGGPAAQLPERTGRPPCTPRRTPGRRDPSRADRPGAGEPPPSCSASRSAANGAEALYADSGGNPFYLQQLARANGGAGDGTGLAGAGLEEVGVPPAVIASLAEELGLLLRRHARRAARRGRLRLPVRARPRRGRRRRQRRDRDGRPSMSCSVSG